MQNETHTLKNILKNFEIIRFDIMIHIFDVWFIEITLKISWDIIFEIKNKII